MAPAWNVDQYLKGYISDHWEKNQSYPFSQYAKYYKTSPQHRTLISLKRPVCCHWRCRLENLPVYALLEAPTIFNYMW